MILEAGQICPHKNVCPYATTTVGEPCHGTFSERQNRFTCDFVINGKVVTDVGTRLPGDKTGRMKVIME